MASRREPLVHETVKSFAETGRDSAPIVRFDSAVLMVRPDHFGVHYAINPHMRDASGALQRVDLPKAKAQWDLLRKAYEGLGYPVFALEGVPKAPDMVFAANQSLPFMDESGSARVLLSRMRHQERSVEVPAIASFYRSRGYEVIGDGGPSGPFLEGQGDVLWHPGRGLLLGGYGFRTDRASLDLVASTLGLDVLAFELCQPGHYHLDTALLPLNAETALCVTSAFKPEGLALLRMVFRNLHEVPPEEATAALAANGHCPDGRNVLLEARAPRTAKLVRSLGFEVHLLETSEFRKSGGSIFCMKMMLPV